MTPIPRPTTRPTSTISRRADSTDERINSIDQAVSDGAKVIVCPGYLFGETSRSAGYSTRTWTSSRLTFPPAISAAYAQQNLYCAVFGEEQAGYLAGYAVVKDGYTKLGFLGGMAVPAVQRYGYGFVQGANAAAVELGTPIEINYTYGGQFFGDANITAKMDGWYTTGTEIVFACGGGIYTSAVEAALNSKAYVVGVDVDQHSSRRKRGRREWLQPVRDLRHEGPEGSDRVPRWASSLTAAGRTSAARLKP